ncbi:prolipoprotein diacylglyceryl transferase [Planctomycetota bacterium]
MWPKLGPIPTYSILYSAGVISHFFVSYWIARRLGLRRRVWIVVSICYMEGMFTGAKVLYDVVQVGQFSLAALFDIEHWMKGGLWGGLLVYLVLAVPLAAVLAKDKRTGLDLVVLTLPIPLFLSKLGCLFNGCCYGRATSLPWAITFPEGSTAPTGVPLHPTQIYELIVIVGVYGVFKLLNYDRWRGSMFWWFLIIYGLGRSLTEVWRGDQEKHAYFGPLSLSQVICLIGAALSVIALYWFCKRRVPAAVSSG